MVVREAPNTRSIPKLNFRNITASIDNKISKGSLKSTKIWWTPEHCDGEPRETFHSQFTLAYGHRSAIKPFTARVPQHCRKSINMFRPATTYTTSSLTAREHLPLSEIDCRAGAKVLSDAGCALTVEEVAAIDSKHRLDSINLSHVPITSRSYRTTYDDATIYRHYKGRERAQAPPHLSNHSNLTFGRHPHEWIPHTTEAYRAHSPSSFSSARSKPASLPPSLSLDHRSNVDNLSLEMGRKSSNQLWFGPTRLIPQSPAIRPNGNTLNDYADARNSARPPWTVKASISAAASDAMKSYETETFSSYEWKPISNANRTIKPARSGNTLYREEGEDRKDQTHGFHESRMKTRNILEWKEPTLNFDGINYLKQEATSNSLWKLPRREADGSVNGADAQAILVGNATTEPNVALMNSKHSNSSSISRQRTSLEKWTTTSSEEFPEHDTKSYPNNCRIDNENWRWNAARLGLLIGGEVGARKGVREWNTATEFAGATSASGAYRSLRSAASRKLPSTETARSTFPRRFWPNKANAFIEGRQLEDGIRFFDARVLREASRTCDAARNKLKSRAGGIARTDMRNHQIHDSRDSHVPLERIMYGAFSPRSYSAKFARNASDKSNKSHIRFG